MADDNNVWLRIMDRYRDSVIQLICVRGAYNPFRPQNLPVDRRVSGSAFIVDIERGLVLTNAHVVSNAISVSGRMMAYGEYDLSLQVISICREKDIALCQLVPADIRKILAHTTPEKINMEFNDSMLTREADIVATLGYPLGQKTLKITTGVISGFFSNTTEEEGETALTEEESPSYIQITAPLNGGNSGGPLLNRKGQVIGVNGAGYLFAQSVAFSIPSRTVLGIYNELLRPLMDANLPRPHVVVTPKFAFEFNRATPDLLELSCKQTGVEGVYIKRVYPNSCFDTLKEGDILAQILYSDIYHNNPKAFSVLDRSATTGQPTVATIDKFGDITLDCQGQSCASYRKLSIKELFDMIPMGQEITVHICRSSNEICDPTSGTCGIYAITTRLVWVPSTIRDPLYPRITPFKYEIIAGMSIGELTINHINMEEELISYAKGKKRYRPALVVNQIFPDTTASQTRVFKEGSIISRINGQKVRTIEDLRQAILATQEYFIFKGQDRERFAVKKDKAIQEDLYALQQFGITTYSYLFAKEK